MRSRLNPSQVQAAALAELLVRAERRHRCTMERIPLPEGLGELEHCSGCGEGRRHLDGVVVAYLPPRRGG